ncbi:MAG: hypothetical protein MUC49_08200 [Raineya sp.]|jgi:hypothetical protein|nr:hypothetical protein [Raineya sp.]
MSKELLVYLVYWSGIGHIVLSFGSLAIPKFLKWKEELAPLQKLLRQMFWTYAGYILVINFCFGLVSLFGTDELLNGSFLAKCITFFIAIYWFARVLIQFLYFDKTNAPKGWFFTLGEIGLVGLFVLFTVVYALAFLYNYSWI